MKPGYAVVCLFLFSSFHAVSGTNKRISREEYIAVHKNDAVKDMQKTGVPASITLAQALLESEDGNSVLATEANNHFGIKCADWTGATFNKDDDRRNECFRKYNSTLESYDDHSYFLRTRERYAFLFQLPVTDYKRWCKGLKKAGYATNPQYAEMLVRIIEDNQLQLLDEGKELPVPSPAVSEPVASVDAHPVIQQKEKKEGRTYQSAPKEVDIFAKRKIQSNNGVDYVVAKKGDTYNSLAKELELGYWQLPKYNESDNDSPLAEGQIIYIKPKKSETSEDSYTVKEGDTVHSISQDFGIKSKYIYKWNNFSDNEEVKPGQRIYLKKKKT